MGVVGGVDEIEVMSPLINERLADLPQAVQGDRPAEILMADLLILTEHAAQGAAGEEDRPRAPGAGDGWLLPMVEGSPGQDGKDGHAAMAGPLRLSADGPAAPGAQIADHGVPSSQKCPRRSATSREKLWKALGTA